ncbi:TonB-dependent receptor plug domain-containing protein [Novosphingobium rhizosphaerae]|uniref:TonB-dependent receptor plug domain-containing protein n=1 Tax=Novosphingobium rhizosphaerae TaxID=1551649 RepID=UPI003D8126B4
MTKQPFRAALLAASSLLATTAHAADAAAANASADPQSTTANQAGQANDAQSLTSSDILVIGSRAAEVAPIAASLTTTQPQAAVSREFIDNANAASDFNQLIAITPSVSISGNNNGTGFTESKATIRGFQDGDYNVTYDSIPFADTNNPTHHSTAFFPTTTIETVVVDRGPGNASQLGQATYGGNINLYSRAAKDEMGGQVQGLLGNWNTFIGRAEFQSGKIDKLGGAKFVLAGQFLRSDGALTNSRSIPRTCLPRR